MNNNIASERKRLNMRQEDLAIELDVSLNTVCKWEKGASVKSSKLVEMANLFGCTLDYLMARTDERTA